MTQGHLPVCSKCFRDIGTNGKQIVPGTPAVCRGCEIEIGRTLGWLKAAGIDVRQLLYDQVDRDLVEATSQEAPPAPPSPDGKKPASKAR